MHRPAVDGAICRQAGGATHSTQSSTEAQRRPPLVMVMLELHRLSFYQVRILNSASYRNRIQKKMRLSYSVRALFKQGLEILIRILFEGDKQCPDTVRFPSKNRSYEQLFSMVPNIPVVGMFRSTQKTHNPAGLES